MIKGDTLLDLSQEWREFAACSDRTDDLFFPSSESDISMVRAAKAVCQSCPVQEECLQYSLDTGQTEASGADSPHVSDELPGGNGLPRSAGQAEVASIRVEARRCLLPTMRMADLHWPSAGT